MLDARDTRSTYVREVNALLHASILFRPGIDSIQCVIFFFAKKIPDVPKVNITDDIFPPIRAFLWLYIYLKKCQKTQQEQFKILTQIAQTNAIDTIFSGSRQCNELAVSTWKTGEYTATSSCIRGHFLCFSPYARTYVPTNRCFDTEAGRDINLQLV